MKINKILTTVAVLGCSVLNLTTFPVEAREVILRQSQRYRYDNYPSRYNQDYEYGNSTQIRRSNRVYINEHNYPYNLRSGNRVPNRRIDDATLVNPTIINSDISDSVLVNPVIINPHHHHRPYDREDNRGTSIYYNSPGKFQIRIRY